MKQVPTRIIIIIVKSREINSKENGESFLICIEYGVNRPSKGFHSEGIISSVWLNKHHRQWKILYFNNNDNMPWEINLVLPYFNLFWTMKSTTKTSSLDPLLIIILNSFCFLFNFCLNIKEEKICIWEQCNLIICLKRKWNMTNHPCLSPNIFFLVTSSVSGINVHVVYFVLNMIAWTWCTQDKKTW